MKNLIHGLAVAALVGLSACGDRAPGTAEETAAAKTPEAAEPGGEVEISTEAQKEGGIRIETAKRGSVPETYQAMGRVMQDAQKPLHIAATGSGRLETLSTALGAAVEPGQVLAVIKPPAGAALMVTAAHKGIVTALHAAEGDQVNELTFLLTMTEVDPLWGVLDIPERTLEQVRQGQKAAIKTAAYPKSWFTGTITSVSPEIDPQSRTVKARVSIENPGGLLKFGMFIDAVVRTGGYFRGIAVRPDAVQHGSAGPFVFVKTCDTGFMPRPVETGRELGGLIEILKGVSPGEKVVVEGAYLVKSEMLQGGGEAKCLD